MGFAVVYAHCRRVPLLKPSLWAFVSPIDNPDPRIECAIEHRSSWRPFLLAIAEFLFV